MVDIAQLVRAPDCGSGGRRFESDYPPHAKISKKAFYTAKRKNKKVTKALSNQAALKAQGNF